jgi:amidase
LLAIIAGPDGLDPRQLAGIRLGSPSFDRASELRVGLLSEGFGWPERSDPEVDAAVEGAVSQFGRLGCVVKPTSVPLHREGGTILGALGATIGRDIFEEPGVGNSFLGFTSPSLTEYFDRAWRARPAALSLPAKIQLIASHVLLNQRIGSRVSLARNLGVVLRRAYDDALHHVDLLALPTVTTTAPLLPRGALAPGEEMAQVWAHSRNTRPFNLTGHPALSVPCAMTNGLPVGMMLVGRRGDDATVTRAARLFAEELYSPPPPLLREPI